MGVKYMQTYMKPENLCKTAPKWYTLKPPETFLQKTRNNGYKKIADSKRKTTLKHNEWTNQWFKLLNLVLQKQYCDVHIFNGMP